MNRIVRSVNERSYRFRDNFLTFLYKRETWIYLCGFSKCFLIFNSRILVAQLKIIIRKTNPTFLVEISFTRCIITPKLRCLYSFNDYKRIGIRVYQYVPSVVNCLSNTCKHRETGISGEYGEYRDKISDQRWRATYPINRATFLNK